MRFWRKVLTKYCAMSMHRSLYPAMERLKSLVHAGTTLGSHSPWSVEVEMSIVRASILTVGILVAVGCGADEVEGPKTGTNSVVNVPPRSPTLGAGGSNANLTPPPISIPTQPTPMTTPPANNPPPPASGGNAPPAGMAPRPPAVIPPP